MPIVVRRPVECARMGPALRMAYGRDAIPGDMLDCLDRLDELTRAAD